MTHHFLPLFATLQKVAGKTFLAAADANLVKECQDEIVFFNAIDHPNCHYLLGAKTTLDNGGILMLTEVKIASTPSPVYVHVAARRLV
jgi:hypothetical protein